MEPNLKISKNGILISSDASLVGLWRTGIDFFSGKEKHKHSQRNTNRFWMQSTRSVLRSGNNFLFSTCFEMASLPPFTKSSKTHCSNSCYHFLSSKPCHFYLLIIQSGRKVVFIILFRISGMEEGGEVPLKEKLNQNASNNKVVSV